jgi:hypothetical protein
VWIRHHEVYQRLAALRFPGVRLESPRDTGDGFREAVLHDPEGNLIELSARVGPPPLVPVRAVIFDLDGTLLDSEPNYYLAGQGAPRPLRRRVHRGGQAPVHRRRQPGHDDRGLRDVAPRAAAPARHDRLDTLLV